MKPNNKADFSKPVFLVVEGTDDELFIRAFIERQGWPDISVKASGGKDKIGELIDLALKDPNFRNEGFAIGVIRDADESPETAITRIQTIFRKCDLPKPQIHRDIASGTFRDRRFQTGAFICPDGKSIGALEDLCIRAIESSPKWACIKEYFQCVYNDPSAIKPNRFSKQQIGVFLSSIEQYDPLALGLSASKKDVWDFENPVFSDLRDFLGSLRLIR